MWPLSFLFKASLPFKKKTPRLWSRQKLFGVRLLKFETSVRRREGVKRVGSHEIIILVEFASWFVCKQGSKVVVWLIPNISYLPHWNWILSFVHPCPQKMSLSIFYYSSPVKFEYWLNWNIVLVPQSWKYVNTVKVGKVLLGKSKCRGSQPKCSKGEKINRSWMWENLNCMCELALRLCVVYVCVYLACTGEGILVMLANAFISWFAFLVLLFIFLFIS